MPFLRFAKDRRGYESTFLLDAHRASERDAPLLLYWFRTPPHVKMGRAALDEETIRVLEDTHPSVDFDWPRILATRPQPSEPPPEPNRPPRARTRDARGDDRRAPRPVRQASPVRDRDVPPHVFDAPPPADTPDETVVEEVLPAVDPVHVAAWERIPEPVSEVSEPDAAVRKFTRIFDAPSGDPALIGSAQPIESLPQTGRLSEPSASERALGSEQLERLRGRYAAVMARIARRVTDPTVVDRLRLVAERANPDGWVTDDEVRAGLAGLDRVYAELVPYVGRRRRRRRPGGRAESGAPARTVPEPAGPSIAHASVEHDQPDGDDPDGDEPDDDSPESGG